MKRLVYGSLLAVLALTLSSCESSGSFTIFGSNSATNDSEGKFTSYVATAAGSPTSFKITLYKASLSENADCTDPVELVDYGTDGQEFELFENPTLFSGSPADGTYNCLILEFKDVMNFKADDEAVAAHAGCVDTDTEYAFDVYRDGEVDDGLWLNIDGDAIDATGTVADPSDDHAVAFISTAAAFSDVLAGGNPINEHQFVELESPLVVPGQATFFWDFTDQVNNSNDGSNDYCWLDPGTLGFR